MKSVKLAIATTALAAATAMVAPPANAYVLGNYDVLTNRYERASWFWAFYPCQTAEPDCLKISAAPRLKFYNYYDGTAHLANGRWTLNVDVSDGLQLPSRLRNADARDVVVGRCHAGRNH